MNATIQTMTIAACTRTCYVWLATLLLMIVEWLIDNYENTVFFLGNVVFCSDRCEIFGCVDFLVRFFTQLFRQTIFITSGVANQSIALECSIAEGSESQWRFIRWQKYKFLLFWHIFFSDSITRSKPNQSFGLDSPLFYAILFKIVILLFRWDGHF